jgi:Protein of unknown function (DUF3224)
VAVRDHLRRAGYDQEVEVIRVAKAQGWFELSSWDEDPYEEFGGDGGKLTRAVVEQTFSGDVEGKGAVQWLMAYREDGTARFVGLQRVEGSIGGRSGSFVMETAGEFDGTVASGEWTVVEGTGTLAGLRGSGRFEAPHGPKATFELEYELDGGGG